jgi:hypothetical protein
MLGELRTVFFSLELQSPPIPEMRISNSKIRELYENLQLQGDIPALSTKRDDGKSQCQIGSDKIRIEEENPAFGIDEFVNVVETVLKALGDDAPPSFMQRCTIRCLAQPNNVPDSRKLLAGEVANVMDAIGPFGRPPSFFGVRFRFSPHFEVENSLPEQEGNDPAAFPVQESEAEKEAEGTVKEVHKGFLTVRFETYSKDPKQVWIEVAASYPGVFHVGDLEEITANVRETYNFLVENCKGFLDQFDKPKDKEGDDEPEEKKGG